MRSPHGRLRDVSLEILYSDGGFLAIDSAIVSLLKGRAGTSPRRRCRLCFHADPANLQQEMLIVMHRSAYVRPHRHHQNAETLTVIEGQCDVLLFDVAGGVTAAFPMSPAVEGGCFFYRMPPGRFHSLSFRSEWLVFLETTIGPFDPDQSEAAEWAPPESDPETGRAYLSRVVALHAGRRLG